MYRNHIQGCKNKSQKVQYPPIQFMCVATKPFVFFHVLTPCWSLNCTNLSSVDLLAGLKHHCLFLLVVKCQHEKRDRCVLWKPTHLRQRPNGPELCQCLRSVCVCVWVTITQLMRQWTDTQSWPNSSEWAVHWHTGVKRSRHRHLPMSKSYISGRLQNKWEYLTLNDTKHLELSAVIMRVPALCNGSKVFVNGPGALIQCQPAHSQKPFALARQEMLENRMG